MGTTRVGVSVVFRFFQFVANIGCFATSLHTDPLNTFILTVTVLNFIYNCYIWFGVPIMGMRAYHGILFSGEILFFSFCTLEVLCSNMFILIATIMITTIMITTIMITTIDIQVASCSLGYSCAGLYYITFIMYWGSSLLLGMDFAKTF